MSAADVDPLFAVEARVHEAAGATCTVPVLYRETTFFGALYTIDPAVARRGFEGLCIEPWPMLDGVPVVVAALEHQGSTLGPYRAFVVAVLARRIGFEATLLRFVLDMRALEEQALWITALGSTSDAAQKAGPAIWGLSHEPADVGITLGPIAEAQVPGELVLRCERPRGPALPCPPLIVFGAREGRLLRTIAEVEGAVRVDAGSRARLGLEGDGAIATVCRSLGLDHGRPRLSFRADRVRARVPLPGDTGPIRAARK